MSNNLASSNVTLTTAAAGSDLGEIYVNAAVGWNAATKLTLNAAGNINVNAPITVQHSGGGLALNYGGNGGNIGTIPAVGTNYHLNAPISFTAASGGSLSINGANYTLLRTIAAIDNIDVTGLSGNYALANSINASGTTYNGPLVGSLASSFRGQFTGLGHIIDGLSVCLLYTSPSPRDS